MIDALIALALAVQPAAATPAPAAEVNAQVVAAAIQPRLPQRFSPEIAIVAAAAEGDLLIITFEAPAAMLAGATPEFISGRFAQGFCGNPGGATMLAGPMSLRIDARPPGGQIMRGAVLETCPAATAAPAAG